MLSVEAGWLLSHYFFFSWTASPLGCPLPFDAPSVQLPTPFFTEMFFLPSEFTSFPSLESLALFFHFPDQITCSMPFPFLSLPKFFLNKFKKKVRDVALLVECLPAQHV